LAWPMIRSAAALLTDLHDLAEPRTNTLAASTELPEPQTINSLPARAL